MTKRTRALVACCSVLIVGLVSSGCSGGDDAGEPTGSLGGGVGAKCTDSAQCTGYDKPSCLTVLKPLENAITDPTHPAAEDYRNMSLDFPGGYCTTTVQDSCNTDAECGAGGGCFRAFEGVSQDTITNLNGLGLPFDVQQFSGLGICLKSCTQDSECRTAEGYKCMTPIDELMATFNSTYAKKFCVKDKDYSYLLQ
jgi:hypothetical protein